MPSLPIYNSNRNIQPNTSGPLQTGAEQPFIDQQKVIKTVADIGQKWSDAQDVMQSTDVKAKHGIALAQIQAEQAADPDFNNAPKYKAKVDALNADLLKGISNGSVRNTMARQLDYDNQIATIKMQSDATAKQLAYNKVQVKNNLDLMQQQKLQAKTDAERQKIDGDMSTLLELQVKSGVMSYAEADKELRDAQVTGVKYEIYADQSTEENNSVVLKELQKNDGKYSYLDPKERLKLIKESQDRIFQNNQTMKREVKVESEARTNTLTTDIANRSVDLQRIDSEFAIPEEQGGVNRETLRNFKKIVIQGNTDTLEAITKEAAFSQDYYNAFDTILNQEDRSQAMELIVKAWADKKLSLEEGAYLDSVLKETGKANPLGMAIRNVWRGTQGYKGVSKEESKRLSGLSLNELIRRARNGIDPVVASKQILTEQAIKINPALGAVTETPSLWFSDDGSIKEATMKDGYLEFIEPKAKASK